MCVHTMKYFSALKRKAVLTYATTWMNLEDVMLRERSRSQKDKFYLIPLTRGACSHESQRDTKYNGGCQGLRGEGTGELGFTWYRTYFLLSFVVYTLLSTIRRM